MSRHRAIRNLNLDEELADDGDEYGQEENPYEDISEEDQVQLEDALSRLNSLIGNPEYESGFTEREMKDALWDSYFDVDQALNSLVEERSKREAKEKKKADGNTCDDSALTALQRLSLQRRSRITNSGLPGVGQLESSKSVRTGTGSSSTSSKRPSEVEGDSSGLASHEASRPSKLATLAATRSRDAKLPSVAPVAAAGPNGKPLSKLQQKMQANLLARQQKKQAAGSAEVEKLRVQREEEEERVKALLLPSGAPIATLFPTSSEKTGFEQVVIAGRSTGSVLRGQEKSDIAVPGGSPFHKTSHLDAFCKPSPDDIVLRAREGTNLAKS